jgi:hypothetical protein
MDLRRRGCGAGSSARDREGEEESDELTTRFFVT